MIVLDTSALLFWTLDPDQLSEGARKAIDQVDKVLVSSVSIWEIALKVKRQRLVIPLEIDDFVGRLQQVERLEILPVDVQTWLDSVDLVWDHRDPVDRTIVVLASRLICPLVTSDGTIAGYYQDRVW